MVSYLAPFTRVLCVNFVIAFYLKGRRLSSPLGAALRPLKFRFLFGKSATTHSGHIYSTEKFMEMPGLLSFGSVALKHVRIQNNLNGFSFIDGVQQTATLSGFFEGVLVVNAYRNQNHRRI